MTFVVGSSKALGNGKFYQNSGKLNSWGRAAERTAANYFKNITFVGGQPLDLSDSPAVLNNAAVTLTVNSRTLTLGGLGEETSGSALTKAGAGTLVLSNDNTYSGATTVSAGVLQIDGESVSRVFVVDAGATLKIGEDAKLSNKTSLSIADGGVVYLHGYVKRNIKSLVIADVEQELTGTYGAIGSGATHEMACFKGPGKLKFGSGFIITIR